MSENLINLDRLKRYDTKLKTWVQNNISVDGKDINVNNAVIQGDLTVKGATNTVNQQTLTIKDNLIAVNGDGTDLSAAGMAGVVAITGGESLYLKDGNYLLNTQNVIKTFNCTPQYSWESEKGKYITYFSVNNKLDEFNNHAPTDINGNRILIGLDPVYGYLDLTWVGGADHQSTSLAGINLVTEWDDEFSPPPIVKSITTVVYNSVVEFSFSNCALDSIGVD